MAGKQPTRTSLAVLWEKAFQEYNEQVEKEGSKRNLRLRLDQFDVGGLVGSIEDVKNAVDESSKAFQKYRHSGSTGDKVREYIGSHLSFVQTVGDNVVASASTAFPPAGAIWTVATFAIKACQAQSEDYNSLLALIGETGNFLKTIQIIEVNFPDCKGYTEFVTETLTAIIGVFAVQTKLMLMKRPMVFLHTLVRGGGDSDLAGAYARVTEALTRLSRANEMMTIKNTEDIKNLVSSLGGKIDFYHEDIMAQLEKQAEGIEINHQAILINQVGIDANQKGIQANQQILSQMLQLLKSDRQEPLAQNKTQTEDSAEALLMNRIVELFAMDVSPESLFSDLPRTYVAGSSDWLFDTEQYQEWLLDKQPFLPIAAGTGQGKSHIAYAAFCHLKDQYHSTPGVSVAYFNCDLSSQTISGSAVDPLRSMLIQISYQDRKFRNKLAEFATMGPSEEIPWDSMPLRRFWTVFRMDKHFRDEEDTKLYLVLDSVNKSIEGVDKLLSKIAKASKKGARLKVLYTTRPENFVADNGEPALQASAEQLRSMKRAVLESQLETLPRLSRFQRVAKRKITDTLLADTFSIFFATRVLKTLETKGLERPAMKTLESFPKDIRSFYIMTVARCLEGRAKRDIEAINLVFTWLSMNNRPLTLQEVYAILSLQSYDKVLDIEEEISNRCANILEITPVKKSQKQIRKAQQLMLERQLERADGVGGTLPGTLTSYPNDDSDFIVHLQDDDMRQHFEDINPRLRAFRAEVVAFETSVRVLVTAIDDAETTSPAAILQDYAANHWAEHLSMLISDDETRDDEEGHYATHNDVQVVVKACLELHCNGRIAAPKMVGITKEPYAEWLVSDMGDKLMNSWFPRFQAEDAQQESIIKQCCESRGRFLEPLVIGHAEHWVRQTREEAATKAFEALMRAFAAASNTGEADDKYLGLPHEVTEERVDALMDYLKSGILVQDFRFHRANAIRLLEQDEDKEAWDAIERSLALLKAHPFAENEDRGSEEFYTLFWAAKIFDELPTPEVNSYCVEAARTTRPASRDERLTSQELLQMLLMYSNRSPEAMDAAVKLFDDLADSPDERGNWLCHYIGHLRSQDRHKEAVEAVTRHGSIRLAMSGDLDQEMHLDYQDSAQQAGLVGVMVATYEDLIDQLEPLRWASPTKFHLAHVYRRIMKDVLKAKELLYQVLDAEGCFDPAQFQQDEELLVRAQMELSDLIYDQFVASKSLSEKANFVRELEGLSKRQLARKSTIDSEHGVYSTSLAKMYQKLGPLDKCYELLDADFTECLTKLGDRSVWNTQNTLMQLSEVLACIPGLEEDASLALCVACYDIKSAGEQDKDDGPILPFGEDTDSDGDSEFGMKHAETAEMAAELSSASSSDSDSDDELVSGSENEPKAIEAAKNKMMPVDTYFECANCQFDDWDDEFRPVMKCTVCAECILCEPCYKGLGTSTLRCSPKHSHLRMPMEGWIGVKDGEIQRIDQEAISVQHWLKQLQEEKWSRAWDEMIRG